MIRQPKAREDDAWKRWLKSGLKLFDRTWSGWALVWWGFSLAVVYGVSITHHLIGVTLLVALSAAAFGVHIAVFDSLASGKRGAWPWLSAIGRDLLERHALYLRSGVIRATVAAILLLALALILSLAVSLADAKPDAVKDAAADPFWKTWSVWAWMWLIPAGWQRGGALGWGHWLIRREGAPSETVEHLTRLAIAINARSYAIVAAVLMLPSIVLLIVFPPLIPLWDLYAAAVCWCIWDDVFGDGDGMKEMEAKASRVSSDVFSGA